MAIIYPERCRGTTLGALKQVKKQGYSTAGEGLWSREMLTKMALQPAYFEPKEPAGIYMNQLERNKQLIDENTEAVLTSGRKLVEAANESNKRIAEVSGKFRDGTEKLGSAIDKFMAVVGKRDFAETVAMTESLVLSLERLAVLEEKGLLDKVIKAMNPNNQTGT